MIKIRKIYSVLVVTPLLFACTTIPSGPSLLVLPGTGKNFDEFRNDEYYCRQYAGSQSEDYSPDSTYAAIGAENAIIGSAFGALTGAAIGGEDGAAIGAGVGLLLGGLAAVQPDYATNYQMQQFYDQSYVQCMYTRGHRVPVSGQFSPEPIKEPSPKYNYPPDHYYNYQDGSIPPPPPGLPPPPPPK